VPGIHVAARPRHGPSPCPDALRQQTEHQSPGASRRACPPGRGPRLTPLRRRWRAERVDAALLHHHDDPPLVLRRLNAAKLRAVILYKDGRINKEGFERVWEHIKVLVEVSRAQGEAGLDRPSPDALSASGQSSPVDILT
jgi:hypothetical protein